MKKIFSFSFPASVLLITSCGGETSSASTASATEAAVANQLAVQDDGSAKDVVKMAAGSKDHISLAAAVKQAEWTDALSKAAFEELPKGTIADPKKPENKTKLQDILQYHVYAGSLKTDLRQDGQTLDQVNGGNITIRKKDGKVVNNTATVIASIPDANSITHVINGVLPPAK